MAHDLKLAATITLVINKEKRRRRYERPRDEYRLSRSLLALSSVEKAFVHALNDEIHAQMGRGMNL